MPQRFNKCQTGPTGTFIKTVKDNGPRGNGNAGQGQLVLDYLMLDRCIPWYEIFEKRMSGAICYAK